MNKNDFLDKLRKKLAILKKSEIDDIVDEYGGYINEKIKKGKTEEEAIKDFGDFDELVKEILSAYKINEEYEEDSKVTNVIVNLFEDIASTIDKLIKKMSANGSEGVVRFIIEMLLVIVIIAICRLPFELIIDMGWGIFGALGNTVGNILNGIWRFIIEIIYLILAVIIFVKYIKERYLNETDTISETKTKNVDSKINETKAHKTKKVVEEEITEEKPSSKTFVKILEIIGKVFAILFTIPTTFTLVGLSVVFALSIILICTGVYFIGIPIIILSFIIPGSMFLEILFKIIASKKINFTKTFITLIVSIILFGVGCALSAVEFMSATYVNIAPEGYELTVKKEEIELENIKNYYFTDYFTSYIVDETITDKVVVEVRYYNDFVDISLDNSYKVYYSYGYRNSFVRFSGKEFFNILKDDFKNKTFHNYALLYEPEILVYGTKENLDIISSNTHNYYWESSNNQNYTNNTFKRSFKVLNVVASNEANSYYFTVEDIDGNTEIVYVENLKEKIESGKTYDFLFKIVDSSLEDSIDSIFDNCTILDVEENNEGNYYNESFY